ncbi:hypothetical protein [Oceanirhabdus sp. W0125-5]|nr:hypothetical protein [Oceanirhabdus sp. W0125-5]WBW95312.1 hypothetical protein OW730_16640 [Oceanirhabdus sp. W0125-5]
MTSENKPKATKQNKKEDGKFRSMQNRHSESELTRNTFATKNK